MPVEVELFTAPWCPRCASAVGKLNALIDDFDDAAVTLRSVDVVEELDYAVALGVVSTPAVAINGELVFAA